MDVSDVKSLGGKFQVITGKSQVKSQVLQVKSQVLHIKSQVASHIKLFAMFGAFIHELCDANLLNMDPPYPYGVLWRHFGERN